jgi:hypothetical protein
VYQPGPFHGSRMTCGLRDRVSGRAQLLPLNGQATRANQPVAGVNLLRNKLQGSRQPTCWPLLRSMWPEQLGRIAMRAQMWQTDARKELGVSAGVHSRWMKTR